MARRQIRFGFLAATAAAVVCAAGPTWAQMGGNRNEADAKLAAMPTRFRSLAEFFEVRSCRDVLAERFRHAGASGGEFRELIGRPGPGGGRPATAALVIQGHIPVKPF